MAEKLGKRQWLESVRQEGMGFDVLYIVGVIY